MFVTSSSLTPADVAYFGAELAKDYTETDGLVQPYVWPFLSGNVPVFGSGTRFMDEYLQFALADLDATMDVDYQSAWAFFAVRPEGPISASPVKVLEIGALELSVSQSQTILTDADLSAVGPSIADGDIHIVGIRFTPWAPSAPNGRYRLYIDGVEVASAASGLDNFFGDGYIGFGGLEQSVSFYYAIYGTGELDDDTMASISTQLSSYANAIEGSEQYAFLPPIGFRTSIEDFLRANGGDTLFFNSIVGCFSGVVENVTPHKFDRTLKVSDMTLNVREMNDNGVDE
ncbi:MAG: hypothetical protein EOM68_20440 [Spirochaetia bacterium]|nr:hypothetical protein [Spirochaetia bacterium]